MNLTITLPEATVKRRRRNNLLGIIALSLLAALGLLFVIVFLSNAFSLRTVNAEEVSYEDLTPNNVGIYVDRLTVLDVYASTKEYYDFENRFDPEAGHETAWHLLAYYEDGSGKTCYVSLSVDRYDYKQDEILDLCEKYLEDESSSVGDLVLSGCFRFSEMSSYGSSYYEEAYEDANGVIPGENTNYDLTYLYATAEEYLNKKAQSDLPILIVGVAFLLPSALGIWALVVHRKKIQPVLTAPSGEACVETLDRQLRNCKIFGWATLLSFLIGFVSLFLFATLDIGFLIAGYVCFLFAGIVFLVLYLTHVPVKKAKKLLDQAGIPPETVAADLNETVFLRERIRCGRKVLLLNGNVCMPLSSIAWVYLREVRNQFGIVTGRYTVLRTFDGKKIEVSSSGEDGNVFRELLETCGAYFVPGLLVGYTPETRARYKERCKKG